MALTGVFNDTKNAPIVAAVMLAAVFPAFSIFFPVFSLFRLPQPPQRCLLHPDVPVYPVRAACRTFHSVQRLSLPAVLPQQLLPPSPLSILHSHIRH
jgi:hypothetical protein